jgi:predicted nucleic acid-binding protein
VRGPPPARWKAASPPSWDSSEAAHPVARHVLDSFVATGRNSAVVSMVTMMELLVRPLRADPPRHHTVLSFVKHHPSLKTVALDLQMAQEAAALRATFRLRPSDALVIGTAIACPVGCLVTNECEWSAKLSPIRDRIGVLLLSDYLPLP